MNAIILAGGLSRRMDGTRKAFLRLGSETFLERILRVLVPLFDSFLIVTNEPRLYAQFDARVVRDEREGVGPLMGIYSGLKASGSEMSFITATDTPLLAEALVRRLIALEQDCDACAPRWKGEVEPLCAVYSRRCLPAIESVLEANPVNPRIISFFPLVRACFVEESTVEELDPEGLSFFNVNTPADYDTLRAILAARQS
jgi:molybdopterin-guanine dinucleotide biosynthesis protein A